MFGFTFTPMEWHTIIFVLCLGLVVLTLLATFAIDRLPTNRSDDNLGWLVAGAMLTAIFMVGAMINFGFLIHHINNIK